MSLSQSSGIVSIPHCPKWTPATKRSFHKFEVYYRGILNRQEGIASKTKNNVSGGVDRYLNPVTAGSVYPPALMPLWGVPSKPEYISVTPQPQPHNWSEAKKQFYKYMCWQFSVNYTVELMLRPNTSNLTNIYDPIEPKQPRFLIVVQRCLYNGPLTSPNLIANGIPFQDTVPSGTAPNQVGTPGRIYNDDTWRTWLKQADPRLLHYEFVTMQPPDPVSDAASFELNPYAKTITIPRKIVNLPSITCNAWAGDPSLSTGSSVVTLFPPANREKYFEDPGNYPYLNDSDGNTTPNCCQPCFLSIIDVTNPNLWATSTSDYFPARWTCIAAVSAKVRMPTILFPAVGIVDPDAQDDAAGGDPNEVTGAYIPSPDDGSANVLLPEWAGHTLQYYSPSP